MANMGATGGGRVGSLLTPASSMRAMRGQHRLECACMCARGESLCACACVCVCVCVCVWLGKWVGVWGGGGEIEWLFRVGFPRPSTLRSPAVSTARGSLVFGGSGRL